MILCLEDYLLLGWFELYTLLVYDGLLEVFEEFVLIAVPINLYMF